MTRWCGSISSALRYPIWLRAGCKICCVIQEGRRLQRRPSCIDLRQTGKSAGRQAVFAAGNMQKRSQVPSSGRGGHLHTESVRPSQTHLLPPEVRILPGTSGNDLCTFPEDWKSACNCLFWTHVLNLEYATIILQNTQIGKIYFKVCVIGERPCAAKRCI